MRPRRNDVNRLMYIIINNTTNTKTSVEGNFPSTYLEDRLEQGDDLIVISHYSNTIKVPFINEEYGSYDTKSGFEWGYKEYPL